MQSTTHATVVSAAAVLNDESEAIIDIEGIEPVGDYLPLPKSYYSPSRRQKLLRDAELGELHRLPLLTSYLQSNIRPCRWFTATHLADLRQLVTLAVIRNGFDKRHVRAAIEYFCRGLLGIGVWVSRDGVNRLEVKSTADDFLSGRPLRIIYRQRIDLPSLLDEFVTTFCNGFPVDPDETEAPDKLVWGMMDKAIGEQSRRIKLGGGSYFNLPIPRNEAAFRLDTKPDEALSLETWPHSPDYRPTIRPERESKAAQVNRRNERIDQLNGSGVLPASVIVERLQAEGFNVSRQRIHAYYAERSIRPECRKSRKAG